MHMLDWGLVQSPAVSFHSCCSMLAVLICCLLQADFSCTTHPLLEQTRWLMTMLCRQQLKPRKQTPGRKNSSSTKEKCLPDHGNNRSKCIYREGAVKVPTKAQDFHYRLLSGAFLCYLRIAHSVAQPTLQTQNSSRSDIWLLAAPREP